MDNDPRIRAQAEKIADRNEECTKENNETVMEFPPIIKILLNILELSQNLICQIKPAIKGRFHSAFNETVTDDLKNVLTLQRTPAFDWLN